MRQVTHALLTRPPLGILKSIRKLQSKYLVRLACVRHAASVHPEPGSNSPFKRRESLPAEVRSWFRPSPAPRLEGARSGRVSVRKNRLLGFSLLRCSVSGFQGSAAPLPGPRRFRFHPKRKEIYYASVAPPSRTFFEILGLFSRRLPAPGGRGAPPPPSPSPAEKAARACYPLPAPGARGHFRKARKSSLRTARGERACGARRAHPRAGGTLQKACGRRLADDAATVLFWAGTIALIPSYTAKRDDRWSPRLPSYG